MLETHASTILCLLNGLLSEAVGLQGEAGGGESDVNYVVIEMKGK